jgi:aldehyde:ferredoxin oxidoreductase
MAVQAATGWDLSIKDLLRIGERATNLARIFNIREGYSRQDDKLPERLFTPLENGPLTGASISKTDFEQGLSDLYQAKGWDSVSAAPTPERLRELDIEWAIDLLPG